jgi:hypothetical protein
VIGCDTCPVVVIVCDAINFFLPIKVFSLMMQKLVFMCNDIRRQLVDLSILSLSIFIFLNQTLLNLIFLVHVSLIRIFPVCISSHQSAITPPRLRMIVCKTIVKLSVFPFPIMFVVKFGVVINFLSQSSSQVALFLPVKSIIFISIETFLAMSLWFQIISSQSLLFRPSKHIALPISLLSCCNFMMQFSISFFKCLYLISYDI